MLEKNASELISTAFDAIVELNVEESVMVMLAAVTGVYGIIGCLRCLRNNGPEEAADSSRDQERKWLLSRFRTLAEKTDSLSHRIDKSIARIEARIQGMESVQETRLGDLQNDLAVTYWQIAKLRSETARSESIACV